MASSGFIGAIGTSEPNAMVVNSLNVLYMCVRSILERPSLFLSAVSESNAKCNGCTDAIGFKRFMRASTVSGFKFTSLMLPSLLKC